MSLELQITPRLQASSMSCWWATTAVVLEYYGNRYLYPWEYRSVFRRPQWRYGSSALDRRLPPPDFAAYDRALSGPDPHLPTVNPRDIAPYMWYELGLPNTARGLRRYCELTGFLGVGNCPAYGAWTLADVERTLRENGPFIFFGFWNGLPHAIVVCGALQGAGTVSYMDPADGTVHRESIGNFNNRMSGMTIGVQAMGFNPVHCDHSPAVGATIALAPGD